MLDTRFENLLGKTFKSVVGEVGGDDIKFTTLDGEEYILFHDQDCCEYVRVEDITGDLDDLVGAPIVQAEKVVNGDKKGETGPAPKYQGDSFTWTFYKLGTSKGRVTIRWYGSSNGYYGESVSFYKVKP